MFHVTEVTASFTNRVGVDLTQAVSRCNYLLSSFGIKVILNVKDTRSRPGLIPHSSHPQLPLRIHPPSQESLPWLLSIAISNGGFCCFVPSVEFVYYSSYVWFLLPTFPTIFPFMNVPFSSVYWVVHVKITTKEDFNLKTNVWYRNLYIPLPILYLCNINNISFFIEKS